MFSLQPSFFFLFLLFTSLISFSTSQVIHLNLDLLSLVFGRFNLPPAALSLFPKGYVTKENFQICLENWLGGLKKWSHGEYANVEGANKIAQDLDLTGDKQETSLQLSDPSDNTQPASWAVGLSLVLLQANSQLKQEQKPTLLMPWIFIPDGQAFHFIMVHGEISRKTSLVGWVKFDPEVPMYSEVAQLLVPKPDIDFIENAHVYLDALYVRHNRHENLKRKSQVDNLTEYQKKDGHLSNIWYKLMDYPWLEKYVKFGKTALEQLLVEYEGKRRSAMAIGDKYAKKLNDMKVWIERGLREVSE